MSAIKDLNVKKISDVSDILLILMEAFPNLSTAIQGVVSAAKNGTGVLKAFGGGLGSIISAHPYITAAVAISGVVSALISLSKKSEEAKQKEAEHYAALQEKSEEAADAIQSISDKFNKSSQTIDKIGKRFAKLSQGVDQLTGANKSLTNDEYADFLDLSNQLAEIFPTLSRNYDENGNAIVSLSGDVDTIYNSLKNLLDIERQIANQKIADNIPDLYSGIKSKSDRYVNDIKDYKAQREELQNLVNKLLDDNFKEGLNQIINQIVEATSFTINNEGKSLEEFNAIVDDYLKVLDKLGVKYKYLSTDDGKNGTPQAYNYEVLNWKEFFKEEIEDEKNNFKIALRDLLSTCQQEISNFNTKIKSAENENKANWGGLLSSIYGWLSTEDSYKVLNDKTQAVVQRIINGLDYKNLNFESWEAAQKWIREKILLLFSGDNSEKISSGVINLQGYFSEFENGKISFNDLIEKINEFKSTINSISDITPESKAVLEAFFGIKFNDDSTNYDELINSVKGKLEDSFDSKVGTLTLEDLKIASELQVPDGTLYSWKELKSKIQDIKNEMKAAREASKTFTDRISGIEKLSSGLNQLDKIYADIKDGGDFDYSSILNNKAFTDAFGNLGDAYNDFIKTVANSPSDINACQEAFNNLVTAYVKNSEELANVTDETRTATIAFLKQKGVANATAIVDEELARKKESLKYATDEYKNATLEEIMTELDAAEAGSIAQQELSKLAIEKIQLNDNPLDLASDINKIMELGNSAKLSTASIANLSEALSLIGEAEKLEEEYKKEISAGSPTWITRSLFAKAQMLRKQAEELKNKPIEYEKNTVSQIKTDYVPSSSTKNSKSSDSSKSEAFNWIEIAINRIEKATDKLKTIVSSAYKTIKSKLGATVDEIGLVNKQIAVQQQAYNRYMQEANSVGLSEDLKEKVHAGAIEINEYDENTRKFIKDYQDWYEKALNCEDAISNLHESLASLYVDSFNNAKNDFKNQLELAEHLTNQYKNSIDMLEAKGYLESTKYYTVLQTAAKSEIETLNNELANLKTAFSNAMNSGEIEKYSESWYSMQNEINGVKEEIAKANIELVKYAKTMREIEWGYFDYTQERISQLTQEADFLIDLMSNSDLHTDEGQLTDEGMASMGLRGQNYNIYMAQADAYAKEILNIDKKIAEDPYNTELIKRREELLKLQQDSIKSAESEKQAIVSLVEDGINLELQALKDLIDKYNESLDSAKDLYEYQKKTKEQASDIAALQKQLTAYENDISEETRAKVQKLTVELAKAEENLQESEYERYISDQKKLLDELYTEYDTILNQRLDNVDALIGDMITSVNDNAGLINQTLTAAASDVGYTITANMQNIWNGAANALDGTISKYGDDFSTKFTAIQAVLNSIQANTSAMAAASDTEFQETVNNTTSETAPTAPPASPTPAAAVPASPPPAAKEITVGGMINASGAKIYSYAGSTSGAYQYYGYDPIYTVLGEKNGYLMVRHHRLSNGVTGWFKKSDVKAYKTGGLVDYTGLAQVDGTPGNPELMLNAKDTENFLKLRDLLRLLSSQSLTVGGLSKFGSPTLSGVADISKMLSALRSSNGGNMGTTVGDIKINIPIEKVENYNDFVTQLQKDRRFENMILSMTVDRIAGGSSFNKNKYKW